MGKISRRLAKIGTLMIKVVIVIISLLLSVSCATKNQENDKHARIREMMSKSVSEILVDGIGRVHVGEALIHKALGKGTVKGIYLYQELIWVGFVLDGQSDGSFIILSSKYFSKAL